MELKSWDRKQHSRSPKLVCCDIHRDQLDRLNTYRMPQGLQYK